MTTKVKSQEMKQSRSLFQLHIGCSLGVVNFSKTYILTRETIYRTRQEANIVS